MYKVLIIEDDSLVRESIKAALELKSYEILIAENGLNALEICKENLPDLVISDIMMPYMDGYQVLDAFQSNPLTSTIPFIFLTALSSPSDIRNGMCRGADDYITKPFKVLDLLKAVEIRLKKKENFEDIINKVTKNISQYLPDELRVPLVSIMGYSDVLINDYDSVNKKEMLEILQHIKEAGGKLHKTIEKFLDNSELTLLAEHLNNSRKIL